MTQFFQFDPKTQLIPQTLTGHGAVLPWRLWLPQNAQQTDRQLPLLLFLHGMGSVGTDNTAHILAADNVVRQFKILSERGEDFIYAAPQTPIPWVDTDWHLPAHAMHREPTPYLALVLDLIDELCREYPVDNKRIYLTGVSMGGFCVWEILQRKPHLAAGALILCGGGDPAYADRITDVPIWCIHGDADPEVPVERTRIMAKAVNEAGGKVKVTEYPGLGHGSWEPGYSDPVYLNWLLDQKRS